MGPVFNILPPVRTKPEDEIRFDKTFDAAVDLLAATEQARPSYAATIRANKIRLIKFVRELTLWGLKEAKDYVELRLDTAESFAKIKMHVDFGDRGDAMRRYEPISNFI